MEKLLKIVLPIEGVSFNIQNSSVLTLELLILKIQSLLQKDFRNIVCLTEDGVNIGTQDDYYREIFSFGKTILYLIDAPSDLSFNGDVEKSNKQWTQEINCKIENTKNFRNDIEDCHNNLFGSIKQFEDNRNIKDFERVYSKFKANFECIKNCQSKLKLFEKGFDILEKYHVNFMQSTSNKLKTRREKQLTVLEKYQEILENSEESFKKLKKISIDKQYIHENKNILSDFFDENKLLSWKKKCEISCHKIIEKIWDTQKKLECVQTSKNYNIQEMSDENIDYYMDEKNLENQVNSSHLEIVISVESKNQNFQNLVDYSELWLDYLNNKTFDSEEAESMQEKILVSAENFVTKYDEVIKQIEASYKFFCIRLLQKMKNFSLIQYNLEMLLQNTNILLEKLINTLSEDVQILEIVNDFEITYENTVIELNRRNEFKIQMKKLLLVANKMINNENKLRYEYIGTYSKKIPDTFFPILQNLMTHQEVQSVYNKLKEDFPFNIDQDKAKSFEVAGDLDNFSSLESKHKSSFSNCSSENGSINLNSDSKQKLRKKCKIDEFLETARIYQDTNEKFIDFQQQLKNTTTSINKKFDECENQIDQKVNNVSKKIIGEFRNYNKIVRLNHIESNSQAVIKRSPFPHILCIDKNLSSISKKPAGKDSKLVIYLPTYSFNDKFITKQNLKGEYSIAKIKKKKEITIQDNFWEKEEGAKEILNILQCKGYQVESGSEDVEFHQVRSEGVECIDDFFGA